MTEILRLVTLGLELVAALVKAFAEHGPALWDKRLKDILPKKLRTSVAREAAEQAAAGQLIPNPSLGSKFPNAP